MDRDEPAPESFEKIRATPADSILSRLANPGLILPIHDPVYFAVLKKSASTRNSPISFAMCSCMMAE